MTSQKHDYTNYDQSAPNFDTSCETIQCVSVANLKGFGPMKNESQAKEVGEFSIMLYEDRLVGIFLPTNVAAAIQTYKYACKYV